MGPLVVSSDPTRTDPVGVRLGWWTAGDDQQKAREVWLASKNHSNRKYNPLSFFASKGLRDTHVDLDLVLISMETKWRSSFLKGGLLQMDPGQTSHSRFRQEDNNYLSLPPLSTGESLRLR